jgi:hypothetical protein
MAGDWIKVEHATIDKPEILQMAELLNVDADTVLGKLFRVWVWFDVQSRDGNAGSVTGNALKRFIDRLVASQGFAACMEKVGWLSDAGIPNFDRHNGESSKKRALTNKRVKRLRNDDSVTKALPEKRREEITPVVPAFAEFWSRYPGPRKIGKVKCLKVWTTENLESVADQILLHVEAMKATPQWQEAGGKYIPAPLTYLNQRRFEDGFPEAPERRLVI